MKRSIYILLALVLALSAGSAVYAQEGETHENVSDNEAVRSHTVDTTKNKDISEDAYNTELFNELSSEQLIIEQIYGGGGKGENSISNSYIELYSFSDIRYSY